jgi:predicted nucleotidyltransferase
VIAFLDSSALIYLVEGAQPFASKMRRQLQALTRTDPAMAEAMSRLAWLECRTAPVKSGDREVLAAYDTFFSRPDYRRPRWLPAPALSKTRVVIVAVDWGYLQSAVASRPDSPDTAPMRLTMRQRQLIHQLVRQQLGERTRVMLFGSRLQDHRQGGDVDLFIESTGRVPRLQQATLKLELEAALQLPVDLVFHQPDQPLAPFQALAKAQARYLVESPP